MATEKDQEKDAFIHNSLLKKAAEAGVVKVYSQKDVGRQVQKVLDGESNVLPRGLVPVRTIEEGKVVNAFLLGDK